VGCQKSQRVSQQEVQEGEGNHPGSNQTFEEHLTAVEKNKQTNKNKKTKNKNKNNHGDLLRMFAIATSFQNSLTFPKTFFNTNNISLNN